MKLSLLIREDLVFSIFFAGLALFGATTPVMTDASPLKRFEPVATVEALKTDKIEVATSKSTSVKTATNTAIKTTSVKSTPSGNYISIAGNTISIFKTDTANFQHNPGSKVGSWGKLLYGHNYSSIFGPIRYLRQGSEFTVSLDGQVKIYVVDLVTAPIAVENVSMSYMKTATHYVNGAKRKYDVVLMTCSGNRVENGQDLDRTLVFAYEK